MTTSNSQRDNHLLPLIKPYFVYQQRMFHELETTIKIETLKKIHIDVLIVSTLSSTTECYIKSKQPVDNPPPTRRFEISLKFTQLTAK